MGATTTWLKNILNHEDRQFLNSKYIVHIQILHVILFHTSIYLMFKLSMLTYFSYADEIWIFMLFTSSKVNDGDSGTLEHACSPSKVTIWGQSWLHSKLKASWGCIPRSHLNKQHFSIWQKQWCLLNQKSAVFFIEMTRTKPIRREYSSVSNFYTKNICESLSVL